MEFKHIEGTGKPLKVVAPEIKTSCKYFTPQKEYLVSGYDRKWGDLGWGIYVVDDDGQSRVCLENDDAHLNGKAWIVTEREQPNTGA